MTESVRDISLQQGLSDFLESPACPSHTMNFYQLDGYFRALAAGPDPQPLENSLPLVFAEKIPIYRSAAQQGQVEVWLRSLYAFHQDEVARNLCNLPCPNVYASLQAERCDIEQWARGFFQGFIVQQESWDGMLKLVTNSHIDSKINSAAISDDLDAILSTVSTVADAEYAVACGTKGEALERIFASLPDSLILLGRLGKMLRETLLSYQGR